MELRIRPLIPTDVVVMDERTTRVRVRSHSRSGPTFRGVDFVTYTVTAPDTANGSGHYVLWHVFKLPETGASGVTIGGPTTVTVGTGGTEPVTPEPGTPAPVTPDEEDAPPAVKLSSKTAGASVQVTLNSMAHTTITSATDITVDLKKFGVPSAIWESSVNINDTDKQGDGERGYSGEPNSVTVDGTKITMALYSRFPGQEADAGNITGMYTITFKQSAGITNPITATGRATVVIKDADSIDHTDDRVVIQSKVKLSKPAGPRGTAVTVSAVGLLGGGATAFLVVGCPDQGKNPAAEDALALLQETNPDATADDLDEDDYPHGTACGEDNDISLGTGTASGGKVSIDIETSSSDFEIGNNPFDKLGNPIWVDNVIGGAFTEGLFRAGDRTMAEPYVPSDVQRGVNMITTVDGSGRTANSPAFFTITPTITPEDEGVQQGDELTILVEDWYYGGHTAATRTTIQGATITIGDEVAVDGPSEVDVDRDGNGEFKIIVPNSARLGDQELKVTGASRDRQGTLGFLFSDAARGRIIIAALDIELEPATVVLGQQFTVNISGFIDEPRPSDHPAGQDIVEVKVGDIVMGKTTGGERIVALSIDTNGDFTNTFQVDATDANAAKLKPGTYRVRVEDWSGRVAIGHITYPEPVIEVDPPVSRRGSQVTLVGSNFPAGRVVHVFYDDDDNDENLLGAVLADSSGDLRMNFTVPSNAEIGDEQDIIAKSQANEFQYRSKSTHALPEQELIVSPAQLSAGGRMRIEGHNMPLFTLVFIDIANIRLSGQGVETDGQGSFVIEDVLVPQLKPGSHTVEALVPTQGDDPARVREVIQIVDIVTRDSDEAFADLIENGTLTRVWNLDRQTQTWSFFDPSPEFAEFNTLTQVSSGQIVTIIMNATDTFQGQTLYPGSNPTNME